jgi:regulator of sirC expression with transglutaminase-like and TPR domain
MERYDEAVKDFDFVLASKPREAYVYAMRGGCYERLEKYPQALADFEAVVRLLNEQGQLREAQEFDIAVQRIRSRLP